MKLGGVDFEIICSASQALLLFTTMDFLMLLALLDPKVGISRLSESNDGAVVIHDKNGNSGELHADDYHLVI